MTPTPEVPVAQYLGSDDVTGNRIRELLRSHGIESIAYGSLGYTVSVRADRADEARRLVAAAIAREALAASVLGSDPTATAWSPVFNGLRGRLVAAPAAVARGGRVDVAMEVENVGGAPAVITSGDPLAFTWTLRNAAGAEVRATWQRAEVLTAVRPETVERGTTRRVTVSMRGTDGAAGAQLDVTTAAWRLAPGRYALAARYAPEADAGARWAGALALPAVAIDVR